MKLIRLTCDQPTFHPVHFNDTGLTLIIGDSSKEKEGSSNGVGKTLILGLVQHCLGANADKKLTSAVPVGGSRYFFLIMELNLNI
ncbi:hypothetical protein [Enterobacter cloacae complex sp. 289A7]|uniref:hypothetical protein n=1 Tax=Enterobacter cloacae complex sp. 289A7 TaxID=3395850 RepID=UPI003CF29B8D